MGMNTWHTWPFGWGMGDSLIFMLAKFVFIGIILGGIIFILKISLGIGRDSPLEVLKKRLARGEITLEEYKRLKRALEEETK